MDKSIGSSHRNKSINIIFPICMVQLMRFIDIAFLHGLIHNTQQISHYRFEFPTNPLNLMPNVTLYQCSFSSFFPSLQIHYYPLIDEFDLALTY